MCVMAPVVFMILIWGVWMMLMALATSMAESVYTTMGARKNGVEDDCRMTNLLLNIQTIHLLSTTLGDMLASTCGKDERVIHDHDAT